MDTTLAPSTVGTSASNSSLYVPPELLREIFTHCDPATLAAVSGASFACLELASKLLYEDIVLGDADSIFKLLSRHDVSGNSYPRSFSSKLIQSS